MSNDNKSNVVQFTGKTFADLPPDQILEENKGVMDVCLIVGQNKDGSLHFCGTISDAAHIILLLECAKKVIMDGVDL